MPTRKNEGFSPSVIAEYGQKMKAAGQFFLPVEEEDNSDEYQHFYFIGKHQGIEVIFDAVICTLRLEHEGELVDVAEARVISTFPDYEKLRSEIDNGGGDAAFEEEVGLFMADVIAELQDEGAIKVQEHIDINEDADFGIGLDIGLQVERVSPEVIEKFVRQFNEGTLQLDETFYSFQIEEGDEG
jgi:hypothetical protein